MPTPKDILAAILNGTASPEELQQFQDGLGFLVRQGQNRYDVRLGAPTPGIAKEAAEIGQSAGSTKPPVSVDGLGNVGPPTRGSLIRKMMAEQLRSGRLSRVKAEDLLGMLEKSPLTYEPAGRPRAVVKEDFQWGRPRVERTGSSFLKASSEGRTRLFEKMTGRFARALKGREGAARGTMVLPLLLMALMGGVSALSGNNDQDSNA